MAYADDQNKRAQAMVDALGDCWPAAAPVLSEFTKQQAKLITHGVTGVGHAKPLQDRLDSDLAFRAAVSEFLKLGEDLQTDPWAETKIWQYCKGSDERTELLRAYVKMFRRFDDITGEFLSSFWSWAAFEVAAKETMKDIGTAVGNVAAKAGESAAEVFASIIKPLLWVLIPLAVLVIVAMMFKDKTS